MIKSNSIAALFLFSDGLFFVVCVLAAIKIEPEYYPADAYMQASWFAHYHYLTVFLLVICARVATAYLFRSIIGVRHHRVIGVASWVLFVLGTALLTFPQYWLHGLGPPARHAYVEQSMSTAMAVQTTGAFVTLLSVVVFALCVIEAIYRRIKHGRDIAPHED